MLQNEGYGTKLFLDLNISSKIYYEFAEMKGLHQYCDKNVSKILLNDRLVTSDLVFGAFNETGI